MSSVENINDLDCLFENDSYKNENSQLLELINDYKNVFDKTFPIFYIPESVTEEELMKILEKCIDNNEDTLFEDLNVFLDENSIY